MTEELITTDIIINQLTEWVENKHPIAPEIWIDAAQKMAVLVSDDQEKLFALQQEVAKLKVLRIELGDTAVKAKVYADASDLYKDMKSQEAKVERIFEQIRLAKVRAKMGQSEFNSQL